MTDKTTETLRRSMCQIVDMAPAAPDLAAVPERPGIAHPVLALAGGFAAVVLFVGVGAALLVQPDTPARHVEISRLGLLRSLRLRRKMRISSLSSSISAPQFLLSPP
jgi:hypothetical protein